METLNNIPVLNDTPKEITRLDDLIDTILILHELVELNEIKSWFLQYVNEDSLFLYIISNNENIYFVAGVVNVIGAYNVSLACMYVIDEYEYIDEDDEDNDDEISKDK